MSGVNGVGGGRRVFLLQACEINKGRSKHCSLCLGWGDRYETPVGRSVGGASSTINGLGVPPGRLDWPVRSTLWHKHDVGEALLAAQSARDRVATSMAWPSCLDRNSSFTFKFVHMSTCLWVRIFPAFQIRSLVITRDGPDSSREGSSAQNRAKHNRQNVVGGRLGGSGEE